ncbi:hypothetical protein KKA14_12685 [bacterium]|nr:hypothetical protein [bacterium]
MTDHLNEEILHIWVKGFLSDQKNQEIEDHLTHCLRCKKTADEIRWLTGTFTVFPKLSVDRDLIEHTMLAWRKDKRKSADSRTGFLQFRRVELSRPIAFAFVAIGLMIGFLLGNMTKIMIDPYADNSTFFAVSLSNTGSDLSDPYMELLLTDQGGDL